MNTSVNLNLDLIVAEVHPSVPHASLRSEGAEGHMVEAAAAAAAPVVDAASVWARVGSSPSSPASPGTVGSSGAPPTIKPGMSYNQMPQQPPPYPGSRGRGFTAGKVCENMCY